MRDSDPDETDKSALMRNVGMLAAVLLGLAGYTFYNSTRSPRAVEKADLLPVATSQASRLVNPQPQAKKTASKAQSRSSFSKLSIGNAALTADEANKPLREWADAFYQVNGLTPEPAHLPKERWTPFARAMAASVCGAGDALSDLEFNSLARDLAPVASEHPVAALAVGSALIREHGTDDMLKAGLNGAQSGKGQEILAFHLSVALALNTSPDSEEGEVQNRIEAAFKALRSMLDATDGLSKLHDRVAVHILYGGTTQSFFQAMHERYAEEIGKTEAAKPWLKKWMAGEHSLQTAWDARGGGWGSGVSRSDAEVFDHESEKARKLFAEAWELAPEAPQPAVSAIYASLSMGDAAGTQNMITWLGKLQTLEVDNRQATTHMLWGLRPRWFGSLEKMRSFGLACAETERYDSSLPWVLLEAHRDFSSEWDVPAEYFKELPASHYNSMKAVFDGAEAEPKRAAWRQVDRTRAAIFAFKCRRYDEASDWLKKLDQKPSHRALSEWEGMDADLLVGKTAAYVDGGAGVALQKAESAEMRFLATDAVKHYEAALKDNSEKLKGAGKSYVEHRLAIAKIEAAVRQGGEEAELMPSDTQFRGWTRSGGGWELDAGAWLHRGRDSWHTTTCEARIGPSFTLEGEVEITDPGKDGAQLWFSYGYPEDGRWVGLRFACNETEKRAMLSSALNTPLEQPKIDVGPRFAFRMISSTSKITLHVDGKPVFENVPPPSSYVQERWSHIGIGAATRSEKTRIRIHKLKVSH